jgi:membrane protein
MPRMPTRETISDALGAPGRFLIDWVDRVLEIEGIDRGIVIGAQAFTALFPALITYAAIVSRSDGSSFADRLVDRFGLEGESAASIQGLFESSSDARAQASVIGLIFVLFSALAFARAMQRLYEHAWRVPKLGLKASHWGLVWLLELLAWIAINPVLDRALPEGIHALASLGIASLLWLSTPYLLLARRVSYGELAPGAFLTAVAMTAAGTASVLVMPELIGRTSAEFGTIGAAFAVVAWLTALAMVLMVSVCGGAVIADWRRRIHGERAAQSA